MRSGFATWLRCIRLDAFSKANASEEKALTKQARRLSREDADGFRAGPHVFVKIHAACDGYDRLSTRSGARSKSFLKLEAVSSEKTLAWPRTSRRQPHNRRTARSRRRKSPQLRHRPLLPPPLPVRQLLLHRPVRPQSRLLRLRVERSPLLPLRSLRRPRSLLARSLCRGILHWSRN